ncbi:hypothetical protein Leryth_026459 [Lithospermum erythrorhizon]|nr:hypothetical protein Leryth_026459 [Lithospermum erythrorhizon]
MQTLTKELTDDLVVSDLEFRGDLCAKMCSMVEKFSPNKIWFIDQMLKVLSEAGNYVKDEVWHSLIVVITNALNLHGYSVRSLYKAVPTGNACASCCLVHWRIWRFVVVVFVYWMPRISLSRRSLRYHGCQDIYKILKAFKLLWNPQNVVRLLHPRDCGRSPRPSINLLKALSPTCEMKRKLGDI